MGAVLSTVHCIHSSTRICGSRVARPMVIHILFPIIHSFRVQSLAPHKQHRYRHSLRCYDATKITVLRIRSHAARRDSFVTVLEINGLYDIIMRRAGLLSFVMNNFLMLLENLLNTEKQLKTPYALYLL